MLISLKQIKRYLPDLQISNLDSFKHKIDTRLSEVESITIKGEGLSSLVAGHVVNVEKHPQSEKLSVCVVDVGQSDNLTIVCGAPNVTAGMHSIVCLVGGSVYSPGTTELVHIEAKAVAGVTSHGMLCSPAELGLSDNHQQIIQLPGELTPGTEVTKEFADTIINIENKAFPHRPDLFCTAGIAREMGAIFNQKFSIPQSNKTAEFFGRGEANLAVAVDMKAKDGCLRFSAVPLGNLEVKPSPLWLQIVLSYSGIRPINNVVDVTNYVMLDIGQPLHAFDYQKIAGQRLIVRNANQNEQLTTLDGKARELEKSMLVVADTQGAQSIAGIMGGESSQITSDTKEVVLEAANWEMYSIRRTSRELGLRSEASTRFEKGLTPEITLQGITQAANMLLDLAGAEVAGEVIDIYPQPAGEKLVEFDLKEVARLIGTQVEKQQVIEILENLGMTVLGAEQISGGALARPDIHADVTVRVPAHRRDINIPADILEEIARFVGYENLTPTLPKRDLRPGELNNSFESKQQIKHILAESGLHEILTYSMVGEELCHKALHNPANLIRVKNPISPELALVRQSLVPSILEKVQANSQKFPQFGLFEISQVALTEKDKNTNLPKQPWLLTAAVINADVDTAFRKLKHSFAALQKNYPELKIAYPTSKVTPPEHLHPHRCGQIWLGETELGWVGMLHPTAIENFSLGNSQVAILELDLTPVLASTSVITEFKPLAKVPAVVRDISIWVDKKLNFAELSAFIAKANVPDIEMVEVVDTYVSKEGKRSFTLRVTLQPQAQTLTAEQISQAVKQVEAACVSMGHEVR